MAEEVIISRQSWHFSFVDNRVKVLFPICTLNWRVNIYVFRQRKGENRRKEGTNIFIKIYSLWYCIHFLKTLTVCFHWNFSLIIIIIRGGKHFCYEIKKSIKSSQLTELFPNNHGNVEEYAKISGRFEGNTWNYKERSVIKHTWSRNGPKVHLPGFWEDWRRVTQKISKNIDWAESRILGALSKLDEFFLNPQVRTCSVAVPGTFRNNGSEKREPTEDHSLGDLSPEAVFSACQPINLNDSEQEETHHGSESF